MKTKNLASMLFVLILFLSITFSKCKLYKKLKLKKAEDAKDFVEVENNKDENIIIDEIRKIKEINQETERIKLKEENIIYKEETITKICENSNDISFKKVEGLILSNNNEIYMVLENNDLGKNEFKALGIIEEMNTFLDEINENLERRILVFKDYEQEDVRKALFICIFFLRKNI